MFNALSFQIVLNSPMVLYAKSLGASATILGVVVGMMPLLVIFQIPAAQYVARVGYKRFVYAGWGMRVIMIFFMALVPITAGFLNAENRLALMLLLLFAFNLSRGISSAGWLPWITSIVPPARRGQYLSREAGAVNLASFSTYVLSGLCLGGGHPRAWQFALLDALAEEKPRFVQEIRLFDLYQGKGIPEGRKSLAFRVVMQDTERTLTDAEADLAITKMVELLAHRFAATLRT